MYINLEYKDITHELIKKLDDDNYKLCYVDTDFDEDFSDDDRHTFVLYFTPISLTKQWGDDWDDRPYEHNAEIPYDDYYTEDDEKVEFTIYSFKIDIDTAKLGVILPRDYYGYNSPFNVEMINNRAVAWMYCTQWSKLKNQFSILAGESVSDVFNKLNEYIKTNENNN